MWIGNWGETYNIFILAQRNMAFKCMNNLASNYLSELVAPYSQDRYPTKAKFQLRFKPTYLQVKII